MRRARAAAVLILCGAVGIPAISQDGDRSEGEVLKGEYSVGRAMEAVYGNFDAETKTSVWSPKPSPSSGGSGIRWPELVRVHVLADDTYVDAGVPRHMLMTWAKPEETGVEEYSCHACGVLMGVSVFRKDGREWKMEASELQLALIGALGRPPKMKAQRLGPHTWGAVAQMGDIHQGELEQAMWIYGPKNGEFHEWFKVELVDDDKYGEFPQDDWCKAKAGEFDLMCVWREIDYSMHPEDAKQVYDLMRTRRTPAGVKQDVWRFDGERFSKMAKQQASVHSK